MTYRYRAISKTGEYVEDVLYTEDEFEVLEMIKSKKLFPISIKKVRNERIYTYIFNTRIKRRDLSIFCRQFYSMIDGGVEMIECLEVLKTQTKNKRLKKATHHISMDIQKGYSLSKAMGKHMDIFPVILINMLEIGEITGNLDLSLKSMSIYFEKEDALERKITSSLIYPTLLTGISVIVLTFLITVIFPIFVEIFEYSELPLPWTTRFILNLGSYLSKYRYIFYGIIVFMISIIMYFRNFYKVKKLIHRFKIELSPMKGINRKIITSKLTRTLSILLSSGIPMIRSVEVTSRIIDNIYVEEKLMDGKEYIKEGCPLSKVIEDIGLFPPMVSSMINVGEVSGTLDELLYKTADYYDLEVETALHRLTILLEPVLLIIMSIFIGFIVFAIVLPIFDMVDII